MNRGRTVNETIDRWSNRVIRRLKAHDDRRPPFDRQQFLEEFWADHPADPRAVELADAFEVAIHKAHGSVARFERELDLP